ncbi:MAG: DNA polymerase, partial [Brevundimonas sp.]|nr:DNA polymerase [Brevundimonas sp.]
TYFERFPGIRTYMDATRAQVRETGMVSTVFGRRIHIPAIHSKSGAERQFGERAAINAPIQGAAADIIRRAMMRMPGALVEAGLSTKMLLQVHDELVFEAPEAEAERAIGVIKRTMEGAAEPAVALTVPLVVDARAAGNWDEAH